MEHKIHLLSERTQTGQQNIPRSNAKSHGGGNVGDISDREIDSIAHKVGFDWESIGTFMDYKKNQIDDLKYIYRDQPVARNARMIKEWADVVASCGESPRTLLAVAFASIQNIEMAQSLVPAEQIEAIRYQEARQETKEKIELINFDIQGISNSSRRFPVVAIGGEGGINVFDGEVTLGSLSIHPSAGSSMQSLPDTSSLPIGSSMQKGGTGSLNIFDGTVKSDNNQHIQIGQPSLLYSRTSNICRGEVADVADAAAKSQNSNLKKPIDNTLCDTVWGQYNDIKNSVGALVGWNRLIGTVFRVGSKYVMTAWHCIHAIIDPFKNGDEKWDFLRDPQVLITFNYPKVVQNQTAFSILDAPYYNKALDIIILELSEPSKLPPMLKLYFRNIPYMEVQYVDIIGYGHPQSNQKHFDLGCNIIHPSDVVMLEAQAWLQNEKSRLKQGLKQGVQPDSLDWGFYGYDRPEKMIFNCYLEKGSSGGPVLTTKCPGGPVVVGVVTNGLPHCFWDLSGAAQLAFHPKYRFEMGTRMTHIYQALVASNIALVNELFQ